MSTNRTSIFTFIPTVLVTVLVSAPVFAAKMDLSTHSAMIDRLKMVIKSIDKSDASSIPSSLRLADLLAERSRLKALAEGEQNCNNCLNAVADRKEAISLYNEVIPRLTDNEQRSQSLLQKAHLLFATGDFAATEKVYKLMTSEGLSKHTPIVLGQAHASFGDVYFQTAKYKEAMSEYEKALKIEQTPQRGLVYYRLSWCLFNLNQTNKAISIMERVLQSKELTRMETSEGAIEDDSFKADVSKDLASFYARTTVNKEKIKNLLNLSPDARKQANLYHLAQETDRLGKKKEAALVWVVYLEMNQKDQTALEAQIRLMKLKHDMGDNKGALATFRNIMDLWKEPGCGETCGALRTDIKNLIVSWNREEKTKLTSDLVVAYALYVQLFPDDFEMLNWGADVAKQRKDYRQAYEFYRQGAEISHQCIKKCKDEGQKKLAFTAQEGALIGEIDMAETAKFSELRLAAYDHYLALNPTGPREFEVRYQKAQVEFERKDYPKAAPMFRSLALEKNSNTQLKTAAASMSIDALTEIKDFAKVEQWSAEYAKTFPASAQKFNLIHRKTVLNGVASKINNKEADEREFARLNTISLDGATAQDKISLYKSKYLLAVKLRNFPESKKANLNLLALKELSADDRHDAEINQIWLAELELDFATAYKLSLKQSGKLTADRLVRLAYLAELAGVDPSKHEDAFLKISQNPSLRSTVIAHKVQRSKNPEATLKSFSKELARSPEVFARLALEVSARTNSIRILEHAYTFPSVQKSTTGSIIGRLLVYNPLNIEIMKLQKSKLDARSDAKLKKSLQDRLTALARVEKFASAAISKKDLVLQAITLDTLMNENARLSEDIKRLPTPKGLTGVNKDKYESLIAAQAAPYATRANQVSRKLSDLWKDDSWSETLAQNYMDARKEYKPALRADIVQLSVHAPTSSKAFLSAALTGKHSDPSAHKIADARKAVKKNPFDNEPVEALKELENMRGNDIAVAHLDARLAKMKGL
ncbi:MAG: tetratricopeptide repeat protein [Bdellovibrionales bacterium]|nr:tetratricopeptide repeat protein [Bdellovibrionales bacterium]